MHLTYLTHSKPMLLVAERFIRNLKFIKKL